MSGVQDDRYRDGDHTAVREPVPGQHQPAPMPPYVQHQPQPQPAQPYGYGRPQGHGYGGSSSWGHPAHDDSLA